MWGLRTPSQPILNLPPGYIALKYNIIKYTNSKQCNHSTHQPRYSTFSNTDSKKIHKLTKGNTNNKEKYTYKNCRSNNASTGSGMLNRKQNTKVKVMLPHQLQCTKHGWQCKQNKINRELR